MIIKFLQRHPEINEKSIMDMRRELEANLYKIQVEAAQTPSSDGKYHSFETEFGFNEGCNNLRILGYDKRTQRFHIQLIDQYYPYRGPEYRWSSI